MKVELDNNDINFWVSRVANEVRNEVMRSILADIGIDALERLIEQGKTNRKIFGYTNEINLTKLYVERLQGIKEDHVKNEIKKDQEISKLNEELRNLRGELLLAKEDLKKEKDKNNPKND